MSEALTGSTGVIGTVAIDSSYIKARRSAADGKGGPSRKPSAARAAGRIHALTDAEGRPHVLLLSPGNINDITFALALTACRADHARLVRAPHGHVVQRVVAMHIGGCADGAASY